MFNCLSAVIEISVLLLKNCLAARG